MTVLDHPRITYLQDTSDPFEIQEPAETDPTAFAFVNFPGGDDGSPVEDWDRFHDRLAPFLRSLVRRGRATDLEDDDAVQEAWLAILSRGRTYRTGPSRSSLLAWILVVVRHHMIDLARQNARRMAIPLEVDVAEALLDPAEGPISRLESAETRALIRETLASLSCDPTDLSHIAFVLRWVEGRSVPEIAARLGLSELQVRDRQRRMLRKLRITLACRLGDDLDQFFRNEVAS